MYSHVCRMKVCVFPAGSARWLKRLHPGGKSVCEWTQVWKRVGCSSGYWGGLLHSDASLNGNSNDMSQMTYSSMVHICVNVSFPKSIFYLKCILCNVYDYDSVDLFVGSRELKGILNGNSTLSCLLTDCNNFNEIMVTCLLNFPVRHFVISWTTAGRDSKDPTLKPFIFFFFIIVWNQLSRVNNRGYS